MFACHCVRTKQSQEFLAARGLREQGFKVYLAKKFTRSRVDRKIVAISSLRFETYLFIWFDWEAQEHGPIRNTRGVAELMCNAGGLPYKLEEEIIADLHQAEDEELDRVIQRIKNDARDFAPGEFVRIDQGDPRVVGSIGAVVSCKRGVVRMFIGNSVWSVPKTDVSSIDAPAKRKAA